MRHADGSFSSYYGQYGGSGLNTSFVQDDLAGYAALQCSQVHANHSPRRQLHLPVQEPCWAVHAPLPEDPT